MRYKSAADLTYFGSTPFGTANKLLFEGRWDIARGKSCRAYVVLPEPAQSQLERRALRRVVGQVKHGACRAVEGQMVDDGRAGRRADVARVCEAGVRRT